jgi:hypothetical protein
MKPHRCGRLLVHYIKTFQTVLLFETLLIYHFERIILRLFVGIAHSRSTLSQSEGIMGSLISIDSFQWHRLGCYLLEAYIALHSLDLPRAS